MIKLFIVFYCVFFFYHMMRNKDSQFIISWCWCAKEEEYSDDDEPSLSKDQEDPAKSNEMDEIRKANQLDYAVLFEQEAMSIS